jgi:hypothetical protein
MTINLPWKNTWNWQTTIKMLEIKHNSSPRSPRQQRRCQSHSLTHFLLSKNKPSCPDHHNPIRNLELYASMRAPWVTVRANSLYRCHVSISLKKILIMIVEIEKRCTEIGSEVHVTESRARETSLSRLSSLAIYNYYFSIYEIVSIYKQLQIGTRKKKHGMVPGRLEVWEKKKPSTEVKREESGSSRFLFFSLSREGVFLFFLILGFLLDFKLNRYWQTDNF